MKNNELTKYGLFLESGELMGETFAYDEEDALHALVDVFTQSQTMDSAETVKQEDGTYTIHLFVDGDPYQDKTFFGCAVHPIPRMEEDHRNAAAELYARLVENVAYYFRAEYLEGVMDYPHDAAIEKAKSELWEYAWKETENE